VKAYDTTFLSSGQKGGKRKIQRFDQYPTHSVGKYKKGHFGNLKIAMIQAKFKDLRSAPTANPTANSIITEVLKADGLLVNFTYTTDP